MANNNKAAVEILTQLAGYAEEAILERAVTEVEWDRKAFSQTYPEIHEVLRRAEEAITDAYNLVEDYYKEVYDNEDPAYYPYGDENPN